MAVWRERKGREGEGREGCNNTTTRQCICAGRGNKGRGVGDTRGQQQQQQQHASRAEPKGENGGCAVTAGGEKEGKGGGRTSMSPHFTQTARMAKQERE